MTAALERLLNSPELGLESFTFMGLKRRKASDLNVGSRGKFIYLSSLIRISTHMQLYKLFTQVLVKVT